MATYRRSLLTLYEPDGSIQAEREWYVTFGSLNN